MARLTKEMRAKMIADGYGAHLEILDINESGYVGCMPNGNLVSRLQYPEAMPVPQNSMMGIPAPKKLRSETTHDYVCISCGKYFLTPEQLAGEGGVHTANMGECAVCGTHDMLLNIRHYNWLRHYKYHPDDKGQNGKHDIQEG